MLRGIRDFIRNVASLSSGAIHPLSDPSSRLTQQELLSTIPATVSTVAIFFALVANEIVKWMDGQKLNVFLIVYCVCGCAYAIVANLFFLPSQKRPARFIAVTVAINGIALGVLSAILLEELNTLWGIILALVCIAYAALFGRKPALIMLTIGGGISLFAHLRLHNTFEKWFTHLGLLLLAYAALETVAQLRARHRSYIRRLEAINHVNYHVTSALSVSQAMTMLYATLQKTMEADTYLVGVLRGGEIHYELLFDGGDYYHGVRVSLDGISGWVIKTQKPLLLSDMRTDLLPDGAKRVIAGSGKPSLSWIGVPLKSSSLTGVIALSSYKANAFNDSDVELLSALSQHVALTLDNIYLHETLREQARTDSLTGVYNHGAFVQKLMELTNLSGMSGEHLGLIMLDLDYFKAYNDMFGHQVGDRVLVEVCRVIRKHIKRTDIIGRWGGEEFAIALPNVNVAEALLVAERIRKHLERLILALAPKKNERIPAPTVSQGIALYPLETDNVARLIAIADQRLYAAKERGRNQIEAPMER